MTDMELFCERGHIRGFLLGNADDDPTCRVPALVPPDIDPESHREAVGLHTIGTEAQAWLR